MSVLPSALKSPTREITGGSPWEPKLDTQWLVAVHPPVPKDRASGIVFQPAPPVRAMSIRPSPSKSPTCLSTDAVEAKPPQFGPAGPPTLLLDVEKLPFCSDIATGIDSQPAPPVRAMSVKLSPLKSPASGNA